jgi:uncharacterized membrane protein
MFTQPFAIPSLALFSFAVPLVLGLISPNRFYGVRTPRTLSDEGVWYAVNRAAGVAVMVASCVYAGVALLWPYDPTAADSFSTWGIHLAGFVLPLLAGIGLVVRASRNR